MDQVMEERGAPPKRADFDADRVAATLEHMLRELTVVDVLMVSSVLDLMAAELTLDLAKQVLSKSGIVAVLDLRDIGRDS